MDVKLLSMLIAGEAGTIIRIRGKTDIHRYLLKLGLTIGRSITIENTGMDLTSRAVVARMGKNILFLDKDIAANINVEVN